jgi:hypothetical protein
MIYLEVQNLFNLMIDLLGFGLFDKNVTIMGLNKRKWHLAYSQLIVLQIKKWLCVSQNSVKTPGCRPQFRLIIGTYIV